MRCLLTGFEPFGPHAVNSSWEAAALLAGTAPDLAVERLPVDHALAEARLCALLDRLRPEVVLLSGLAPSPFLRLEQLARKPGTFAGREGPDALEGDWPWEASLAALAEAGLPAQPWRDAGRYVCETSYWSALDHRRRRGGPARVMFLHVPPLSEDWPRERIAQAMRILLGLSPAGTPPGPTPSDGRCP